MKQNTAFKRISSLLIMVLPLLLAAQGNLGQSGANFLQIPADAKGAALGGAGVASVTGAAGLHWNPAAIAQVQGIDLNVAYTTWFIDTRLTYATAAMSLSGNNAMGLILTNFGMDDAEITTEQDPDGTGDYYSAGNLAVGFSFARQMTDRFAFGVTCKFVQETIWNSTASQVAVDLGSTYDTGFKELVLAMAIRNVGGTLLFPEDSDDISSRLAEEEARGDASNPRLERLTPGYRLPQVFQVGIAFIPYRTESIYWQMIIDADVPSDNTERIILASELGIGNRVFVRAAYRDGFDFGKLSFGAGLQFPLGANLLRLDYALVLSDHFGSLHTIGIGTSL